MRICGAGEEVHNLCLINDRCHLAENVKTAARFWLPSVMREERLETSP